MSDVEWRPVVGYEGKYEVASNGQVRSLTRMIRHYCGGTRIHRGRILALTIRDGYPQVMLYSEGRGRIIPLHQVVLTAFVGPRPLGMEVLHADRNRLNADMSNLRWGTHTENVRDAVRHGTQVGMDRERCPRGHRLVVPNLVRSNLALGWRMCRACHQTHAYLTKRPDLDFQTESDRRFARIMAEPVAGRLSAGRVPAQRSAQVGPDLSRDNPEPTSATTLGGAPF